MRYRSSGKRYYEPYDPQPSPSDVVTLTRYYVSLSADSKFRRRVTWIASTSNSTSNIAIFEYFGQHASSGEPHGNHRDRVGKAPYVRTPATTMDDVAEKLKSQRPQEVYNDHVATDDINDAPRDSRVVHNKKAAISRAVAAASGKTTCRNIGDEVQQMLSMVQSDNFVRCVVVTRDRVPSVILYTDRQIQDLKSFCFSRPDGSVLGFDKTYNLGAMFVTPSVYKNPALIRRRTNDSPIFIGPLFVHGHSDVDTYGQFFGHLSLKLIDSNSQQLTLGSDDELAVRKCFKHFFPRAATVVCSRHLKENVGRKER